MEVNLLKYFGQKDIVLNLKAKNKKNAISVLVDHLLKNKKVKKPHKKEIMQAVLRREGMGSTAIGGHIALPHARINCVKNVMITVGISRGGIDFESLDGELVNVIVLLLSNKKEAGGHLKTLAALAKILKDKSFIQYLKEAKSEKEVIKLIEKQQSILR